MELLAIELLKQGSSLVVIDNINYTTNYIGNRRKLLAKTLISDNHLQTLLDRNLLKEENLDSIDKDNRVIQSYTINNQIKLIPLETIMTTTEKSIGIESRMLNCPLIYHPFISLEKVDIKREILESIAIEREIIREKIKEILESIAIEREIIREKIKEILGTKSLFPIPISSVVSIFKPIILRTSISRSIIIRTYIIDYIQLNALTMYPKNPPRGEKGEVLENKPIVFKKHHKNITEEIKGVNSRIIICPEGYIIGLKDRLLTSIIKIKDPGLILIEDPKLIEIKDTDSIKKSDKNIVNVITPIAEASHKYIANILSLNEICVIYLDVYGDKNSKSHTSDQFLYEYRLLDIASIYLKGTKHMTIESINYLREASPYTSFQKYIDIQVLSFINDKVDRYNKGNKISLPTGKSSQNSI